MDNIKKICDKMDELSKLHNYCMNCINKSNEIQSIIGMIGNEEQNNLNSFIDDSLPYTCLIAACHFENLSIIEALINKGVDLEKSNSMTALHISIIKGNYDVVKLLIDSGANVNCKDRCGVDCLADLSNSHACNCIKKKILLLLFDNNIIVTQHAKRQFELKNKEIYHLIINYEKTKLKK